MEITRDNLLSLIQGGLKQQALSIAALEKNAGVPKDTVRDFLRAKTQILRADKLQKILRVLQPEGRLAVRFELGPDAEIIARADTAEKHYVDYPPGMDSGVEAVLVTGDAMAPVFHDGWVIYYTTGKQEAVVSRSAPHVPYGAKPGANDAYAAFLGKPCVIRLEDDRLMLRTLKPGAHGAYTLAAYQVPDMKDVAVKNIYKIVYIKV